MHGDELPRSLVCSWTVLKSCFQGRFPMALLHALHHREVFGKS